MRLQHPAPSGSTISHALVWPNCPRCGDTLWTAESSVLVGSDHILHSWCCDSCGQSFETAISLHTADAA